MLGLWLVLLGLSSSDSLHRQLHADAGHVSHDCLVKFLGTSADLAPPPAMLRPPDFVPAGVARCTDEFLPASSDLLLPAGRAPPAA